jgi:hypothetical protein
MRRHVVGTFVGVPISARVLRRQTIEKRLQIIANVPRGVLLYKQSGRGVPAKQGQQPGLDRMRFQPIQDVARNLTRLRPGVVIEIISTACRIALFADLQMAVASGTFREFWRCWGARAPAVNPTRGQNAAYHPYHSNHSDRGRRAFLALQYGLGLLPGGRTRNTADHRPHSRLARICVARRRRLHSTCPNENGPRRDLRRGHYFERVRQSVGRYLRQMTPARKPSPRARASVASGRS